MMEQIDRLIADMEIAEWYAKNPPESEIFEWNEPLDDLEEYE